MDYEKRYKEALDVARRKICVDKAGMVDTFTPNDIYEMFPELAESEDERIRKWLICTLKSLNSTAVQIDGAYEMMLPAIAWLEKQGEHANFINKIQIGDKVTRNEDGVLVNLSQLNRVAKKQGEQILDNSAKTCKDGQKPADVEPKFKVKYAGCEYNVLEVKDIVGVTYYGIEYEPNHIDYVKADNCEIISGGYGIKENGSPYPTKPAVFSEQKPVEWSEEDGKTKDNLISELSNLATRRLIKNETYSKYSSWLKSLRPQKHWKPSDEQIRVVARLRHSLLEDVRGDDIVILDNLLEQLKAQKGE